MSEFDLVVCGRVVTPDAVLDQGWVAVSGETIAAVGTGTPPAAKVVHDAGDAYVLPGAIDGQTHATSYGGLPGLESTTRSAVAGGVTTIVDMPYDSPDPLDSMEKFRAKAEAVALYSHGDVALYGTVSAGQPLDQIEALRDAGICAIKISWFESNPRRFPRIPADQTLALLKEAARVGLPVGLHNEDQEIVLAEIARLKAEGKITPEWHEPSRPEAAELAATVGFLELGVAAGAHVHIVHISTPRGYDLVTRYREDGFNATAELCIHYLLLDAGRDTARLGARMKVSPPIRAGVIDQLWQRLEEGAVEFVSSDHSSWPIANKFKESIFDAGAGIPGLETLVPSFFTVLKERVEDPALWMAKYLSEKPAKFFGLWPRKGALMPGFDADILVLKPEDVVFDAAKTHDDLNWSPFDGDTFAASVTATWLRGQPVFADGVVLGKPGDGRYIPRIAPEAAA